MSNQLESVRFPRAARYHSNWIKAGASGGAHVLRLAEWLSEALPMEPGMRVLDLACGRALSSVFLQREFGVNVWAADLWFDPAENLKRVTDAGVGDNVFPLRADARALPFGAGFFDAIVCLDAFMYFGTDDTYLPNVLRFLRPGGRIGFAMSGLIEEFDTGVPSHLASWWTPDMWCLHSAAWWQRHWARTGLVEVECADVMPRGWETWLEWQRFLCPDNTVEIAALEADRGQNLGYVRAVARRLENIIDDPIVSIATQYENRDLLSGK